MKKDIEILKQLEQEIGIKLKRTEFNKIMTLKSEALKAYALDANEKVIGLNLADQHLDSLPSSLLQFQNLLSLNLYNSTLTQFPLEIFNCKKLKVLDLSYNNISSLPEEIVELEIDIFWESDYEVETGIYLERNPIKYPPLEIVRQGKDAIKEYFSSLKGEKQALNEVKIILIGDGGAGKTSLVKLLFGERFNKNELQTHGINIRDLTIKDNGKDINVHFWDFGGQEIMHATHQFFLSKRSLYILVLDGRKEEDPEYWLKHIESFGGNSPILVVLNKMDENPGFDVNRKFLFDKYKGIKSVNRVSCANGNGIKEFSDKLIKTLSSVELLETTWAKSWFSVKKKLESMKDDFISYDEYSSICDEANIKDKPMQNILVDFLNDLGVVLHFNDFKLLDTHILNPKWVTQAVYKIINSEDLAQAKGILELNFLDKLLKKKKKADYYYPAEKYRYIIELMVKFELCYEINDETVLIPDLLDIQEPDFSFNNSKSLNFLIEYDFLPKSIMPRFIVKMHKDIKDNFRWRTGVVLEYKSFNSIALIKVDERDKQIYIYVNGEQKRDYFSVIRHAFLTINGSFEKLEVIEKVPMPDSHDITISYGHLLRLEQMNIKKYIPDGSNKEYDVKELLGTIHFGNKTEDEVLQLLYKIKDESDTQDTLLKKANDVVQLQPNFFGLGININQLIKKLFNKKKSNKSLL